MTQPPDASRLRCTGSIVAGAIATAGLVAVVLALPQHVRTAGWLYVTFVGALGLRLLARATHVPARIDGPLAFDLALRERPLRTLPLARDPELEWIVAGSTKTAADVHYRLRRRLMVIAAERLEAKHGLILGEDTDAVRRIVGDEAWALLRPDREAPEERHGPGMTIEEIERIVDAVERL